MAGKVFQHRAWQAEKEPLEMLLSGEFQGRASADSSGWGLALRGGERRRSVRTAEGRAGEAAGGSGRALLALPRRLDVTLKAAGSTDRV